MKHKPRRALRRLIDRACDRAEAVAPGQPDPLTPLERRVLLAAIDAAARPNPRTGAATRHLLRQRNARGRAELRAVLADLSAAPC